MTPLTVNSIPWMPERAWTVARANCAISGLVRSDYSPENVQPNPPCMGPETDPNPPYDVDCLPRYVPWRELPRTPDFDGGEVPIVWQRTLGWGFPDNCVADPPVLTSTFEGSENCLEDELWTCVATGGSGSYGFLWKIWNEYSSEGTPLITATTQNVARTGGVDEVSGCNGQWKVRVTDLVTGLWVEDTGVWQHCCV